MARPHEDERLTQARSATHESKALEFKGQFDPTDPRELVEVVKDLVAIANSGGGAIVVGLSTNATPTGADVSAIVDLDPAELTNQALKYTGDQFSGFEIHGIDRSGTRLAAILVDAAGEAPLVFIKPGTYPLAGGKQDRAFSQGTVYFRHGAKSEPATQDDIREFIERRLAAVRESWLSGIRHVVTAPADAEVALIQRTESQEGSTRIRVTTDPGEPVYGKVSPDESHPYRQTELITEVNRRLPKRARKINQHDIKCVRRVHRIQPSTSPEFIHQGKHALAPQYSPAFVEWLLARRKRDVRFFEKTRDSARRQLRGR